jgi:hypothetical protein
MSDAPQHVRLKDEAAGNILLSWEAQALIATLIKTAKNHANIENKSLNEVVEYFTSLPKEIVEIGLKECIELGELLTSRTRALKVEPPPLSGAERTQRWRTKRTPVVNGVTKCDDAVTGRHKEQGEEGHVTKCDDAVTDRHAPPLLALASKENLRVKNLRVKNLRVKNLNSKANIQTSVSEFDKPQPRATKRTQGTGTAKRNASREGKLVRVVENFAPACSELFGLDTAGRASLLAQLQASGVSEAEETSRVRKVLEDEVFRLYVAIRGKRTGEKFLKGTGTWRDACFKIGVSCLEAGITPEVVFAYAESHNNTPQPFPSIHAVASARILEPACAFKRRNGTISIDEVVGAIDEGMKKAEAGRYSLVPSHERTLSSIPKWASMVAKDEGISAYDVVTWAAFGYWSTRDDEWLRKAGHPIQMFEKNLNRWWLRGKRMQERSKAQGRIGEINLEQQAILKELEAIDDGERRKGSERVNKLRGRLIECRRTAKDLERTMEDNFADGRRKDEVA